VSNSTDSRASSVTSITDIDDPLYTDKLKLVPCNLQNLIKSLTPLSEELKNQKSNDIVIAFGYPGSSKSTILNSLTLGANSLQIKKRGFGAQQTTVIDVKKGVSASFKISHS